MQSAKHEFLLSIPLCGKRFKTTVFDCSLFIVRSGARLISLPEETLYK